MKAAARNDPEVLAVARRYEPAMVAVFVIVIALLVAPRSNHGSSLRDLAAPVAAPIPAAPAAPVSATSPPEADAPVELSRPPATAPRAPQVAAGPVPTQPPAPTTTTNTTTTMAVVAPPEPLEVVEAGWAGSEGGVPVDVDVPEGTLPVSVTFGNPDRRSFLRLSGAGTQFVLDTRSEQPGTRFPDAAAIWLCPVTEVAWTAEADMDDPPSFDCTRHTAGDEVEGRWSFDLAGLGAPDRPEGFVLVAADETADFQVLFADPTTD